MAKMHGAGVMGTVAKKGGAHCGKNRWSWCDELWQKWVELITSEMGQAHCDTNRWSSQWQKLSYSLNRKWKAMSRKLSSKAFNEQKCLINYGSFK